MLCGAVIVTAGLEVLSAPGAVIKHKFGLLVGGNRLLYKFSRFLKGVGTGGFSHPHAYGYRRGTEIFSFASYQLQRTNQSGGAYELITG